MFVYFFEPGNFGIFVRSRFRRHIIFKFYQIDVVQGIVSHAEVPWGIVKTVMGDKPNMSGMDAEFASEVPVYRLFQCFAPKNSASRYEPFPFVGFVGASAEKKLLFFAAASHDDQINGRNGNRLKDFFKKWIGDMVFIYHFLNQPHFFFRFGYFFGRFFSGFFRARI